MKTSPFLKNPLITREEVFKFCEEAKKNNFNMVPVPINFLGQVRDKFPELKFSALIGYPFGTSLPQAKKVETQEAVKLEVAGIELLLNVSAIKGRDEETLKREIDLVTKAAGKIPVKIVLEDSMLDSNDGRFIYALLEEYDLVVRDGIGSDRGGLRTSGGRLYGKIVRVKLDDLSVSIEEQPENYGILAGRPLAVRILSEGNLALESALSEHNKLVIAPGLLDGFRISGACRVTMAAKSPLTGTLKSPFLLGNTGFLLGNIGLRALVIEGKHQGDEWYLLRITNDKVEVLPANKFLGLKTFQLVEKLKGNFGEKIGVLAIGPAGEREYYTSTVLGLDYQGLPTEMLSRGGGLGAVLGSKKIKAIIIDPERSGFLNPKNREIFANFSDQFEGILNKNTLISRSFKKYGSSVFLDLVNQAGALPTRNFTSGNFDRASYINHLALHEKLSVKGKNTGLSCCYFCNISCSNRYPDLDGGVITNRLGYDSLAGFGANLGLDSLIEIANLERWALEFGVDHTELAATLGFMLGEHHKGDFANLALIMKLLERMEKSEGFDSILNQGVAILGRALGYERIPALKGEALSFYDPRVLKTMGASYLTSTQISDPLSAFPLASELLKLRKDEMDNSRKIGELTSNYQLIGVALDFLGFCPFLLFPLVEDTTLLDLMMELANNALGIRIPAKEVLIRSRYTIDRERNFNHRAGVADMDLPRFFYQEKLPPRDTVFDLNFDDLKKAF
ncbi:MAG: aldehyde ferredoxin oxidoreductase C-terminal domain-containing protein [Candidatus Wallbacteria bacterium]|nr:aldehyde ferredoxin oxidoreductase C-terminal domain-containing protein [Candidatus Wallbacteria bacterium]